MVNYDLFAKFYDSVMGDRQHSFERVIELIKKHKSDAKTVLELGAGTGSVLKGLSEQYEVSGVELSPEMLKVAQEKVPQAKLHLGDISDFNLGATFDVVICVFDTINHLLEFGQWQQMFRCAHEHLKDGGLFIFDINTLGRLAKLSTEDAHVREFDGNYMLMKINELSPSTFDWDIKIFEKQEADVFRLYQENIIEASFPIAEIQDALSKNYEIKDVIDIGQEPPSDNAKRIFFVCERK